MEMRTLINLVSAPQTLKEASYAYSHHNASCVAFYPAARNKPPSIIFYREDGSSLMNTDEVTITIVYPKKLKELFELAYGRKDAEAQKKYLELKMALRNADSISRNLPIFKKYPEYFKTVTIQGREKLFRYITTDLKMQQQMFEKLFGFFKGDLSEDHTEKFHNALLIFPESMRESRRKILLSMLERTYQHLEKAGLAKVFGGKIRCIQTGSKTAATYLPATQTMTVTPLDSNEDSMVATMIHEYAHKLWYEFMTTEQRDMIRKKFKELYYKERIRAQVDFDVAEEKRKRDVNADLLQMGTILTYVGKSTKYAKRGEKFVVSRIDHTGVISVARESDTSERKTTVFYGRPSQFLNNPRWSVEGNEPRTKSGGDYTLESDSWFPTKYSTTADEEWWAECFMLLVLGHLHGEPGKWFSQFIR